MTRRLFILLSCSLLLWGALLLPAWLLWGQGQLVQSLSALALVVVPAAATLIWAEHAHLRAPDMQLLAALGSSGLRMAVALGGAVVLILGFPQVFDLLFWGWLVILYLAVLALEISLLVRAAPVREEVVGAQAIPPKGTRA